MIPVVSFAMLKGRCRSCKNAIPGLLIAVEIAGVVIALIAVSFFQGFESVLAACLGWCLLLLALIDLEHFILPDRLVGALAAGAILDTVLFEHPSALDRAIGAVLGGLFMGMVSSLYRSVRGKPGLGFGDVKFVAAAGLWLGWRDLPMMIVLAGLLGIAHAVVMARAGPVTATTPIPLGTWMAAALWAIWLGRHGQF